MGLELRGSISLDGSGWEAGINKVTHSLKDLALEAAGIYTITQAITKTVELGEKLIDTSRRIGVSVEALQEFTFAARQNGSSIENLITFIERLNSARINPKKFASFEKLGLGERERNLPVEELMMKLSVNLRARSSQEIIGPLRDIAGRGAGELVPMLKDDLDEVREAARKLGAVMRMEDAVMLKFLADEMKILSQVILIGLAPAIVFLTEKMMSFVNSVKASGTFWGNLLGKPGLAKDAGESAGATVAYMFGLATKRDEDAIKKLHQRFVDAGAASEAELNDLNEATDKQKQTLLDKQKAIEKINAFPDFSEVMGEEKQKKGPRIRDNSDSLVRVGNFLGASRDVLQSLGERQVQLLQQIATNTRPAAVGGGFDDTDFPI
jgi:hypothetical protein